MRWSQMGSVELITINWKIKYHSRMRGFRVTKPDDQYLHSLLSWQKVGAGWEFSLNDMKSTDLKTGIV